MRIAAYAAVPLVLAGGIIAVRAWDPGGEAGVASPPPAFAAHSTPASAAPEAGTAGAGKAEAASDDAVPRAEPSSSAKPEKTGGSEAGRPDADKSGEKQPDAKKPESKESGEKSGNESETGEHGGEDPGGGGVVEPVGEADASGLVGLLAPESGRAVSGEPGTKEPSDKGEAEAPSGKALPGHSKHTDGQAMGYFLWRWGQQDAAVKRITDIRTVGGYLRIYTKMSDTAVNSKHAVKLCERGRKYLSEERGVRHPVVFVHARAGLNGNPVLANDLGAGDKNCRLTTPRPR